MFGHKPGAGDARGATPAPSATRTAARRWRALIGVALVVGLLAGGCAGPTPAPPPSPTPGTASTVVVEPSPTPTPAIVVEPSPSPENENEELAAHETIDDEQTGTLPLQDEGREAVEGTPTLSVPPAPESMEFIHFEPITDISKIKNSIIYKIAGGKYIQIDDLVPRIIQMDNGASVTLSEAIYSELLSQIPKTDLENMTPEESHKRISELAGSSEWAETLKYFTDKNNANTLGRNLLNIGPTAKLFISPDGSIIDFDLLPDRNGQSTIVTVLQKKTNGNETKYLRTGPSEEHLREYYLSKRVGQILIDILWSEKLNKLILTDGYVATSYFDPETNSWKKVEPSQMQDYKVLSPEQEENYIIDQLKTKKATYNSAQYEFTDYISTSEYPQTFILVGGENGFTEEFANQIKQTLKWLLDKSPTFRKNYLESDIRFIARPTSNPEDYLSWPTNIGRIYGYELSTDRFFGYDITQRKVLLPLNLAHEISRIAKIQEGVSGEEHDKAVYKDQGEIVNEILTYFTKEEQKALLFFHEGDATYMNLSP